MGNCSGGETFIPPWEDGGVSTIAPKSDRKSKKAKRKKRMNIRAAGEEIVIAENFRVLEPNAPSEFEVQAYLWNALREAGLNARGEVKTIFNGRAVCRFDIAIFKDGELSAIIETKKSPIRHKSSWEDTRQGKRYMQFGVPVHLVYGLDQAKALVAQMSGVSLP